MFTLTLILSFLFLYKKSFLKDNNKSTWTMHTSTHEQSTVWKVIASVKNNFCRSVCVKAYKLYMSAKFCAWHVIDGYIYLNFYKKIQLLHYKMCLLWWSSECKRNFYEKCVWWGKADACFVFTRVQAVTVVNLLLYAFLWASVI